MELVKVEDSLPPKVTGDNTSEYVLIKRAFRSYEIGYYDYSINTWIIKGREVDNVTHWMEIEEPKD